MKALQAVCTSSPIRDLTAVRPEHMKHCIEIESHEALDEEQCCIKLGKLSLE